MAGRTACSLTLTAISLFHLQFGYGERFTWKMPYNCDVKIIRRQLSLQLKMSFDTRKAQGDAEELEDLADEVERLASLPPEAQG